MRWLAWCEAKRKRYEASRRRWRELHPLIDVAALEALHGIEQPLLSIEKLKAPALKIEDKPPS